MRNKLLVIGMVILAMLAIVQTAYYHPRLPEQVASHFNAKGEADGFTSKSKHAILMLALQLGLLAMFAAIWLACKYLPSSMINIPHRDYWLAPERRAKTLSELNAGLFAMAIGTQLLFLGMNQLIIWHNLGFAGMTGGWMWALIAVFLLYTFAFCIWLVVKFRKPAGAAAG